jgi:hypothetical protein
MNQIIRLLGFVGLLESFVIIISILWAAGLWGRGIAPALLRLGHGLAKRKIAIFAKGENIGSLKHLLVDSGLFNTKNIIEVTKKDDMGRAEYTTMYLVVWHDWADDIDEILRMKKDSSALIVYAPYEHGRIADDQMKKLDGKRHTAVTNFRGRLLNDVVSSMITTGYEK